MKERRVDNENEECEYVIEDNQEDDEFKTVFVKNAGGKNKWENKE